MIEDGGNAGREVIDGRNRCFRDAFGWQNREAWEGWYGVQAAEAAYECR